MLVIQHQIPDLKGRTCTKLLAMQFWHRGVLASDLVAVHIGLDDSSWHKVFFDYGVLFWKQEPPICDTLVTDEYHYPLVDLSSRFPVCDSSVEDVVAVDAGASGALLRIIFRGGDSLELREQAGEMDMVYETRPST